MGFNIPQSIAETSFPGVLDIRVASASINRSISSYYNIVSSVEGLVEYVTLRISYVTGPSQSGASSTTTLPLINGVPLAVERWVLFILKRL